MVLMIIEGCRALSFDFDDEMNLFDIYLFNVNLKVLFLTAVLYVPLNFPFSIEPQ